MTDRDIAGTEASTEVEGPDRSDGVAAMDDRLAATDLNRMAASAARASSFLKSLGHEGRLMILCHLASGEKSVGELEDLLGARQAAVSQQLARLRLEGLVTTRREGKTVHYSLADGRSQRMIALLYELFCEVR